MRKIPVDPITNSTDSWQTVPAEPDPSNPSAEPGIYDVKSGAPGSGTRRHRLFRVRASRVKGEAKANRDAAFACRLHFFSNLRASYPRCRGPFARV